MKYYFDCEFIEGFHKPLFGKRRHFIDLISIGLVNEHGEAFYAISNEFDPYLADDWVTENVLKPIYEEETKKLWNRYKYIGVYVGFPEEYSHKRMKRLIKAVGYSNKDIARNLLKFMYPKEWEALFPEKEEFYQRTCKYGWGKDIELYGYYSAYDHVLLSSLFGRMIDLPKDFPMFTIDLKQIMDYKVNNLRNRDFFTHFHIKEELSFEEKLKLVKTKNLRYPKQENEHNSLSDAKFNKDLHSFLENL